jgi:hypothetical protein
VDARQSDDQARGDGTKTRGSHVETAQLRSGKLKARRQSSSHGEEV